MKLPAPAFVFQKLAAGGLATYSLVTAATAQELPAGNYSIWMAKSIMSRNQGIVEDEADSGIWLQAGITQKAFQAILNTYGNATDADTEEIAAYIEKSAASVAVPLSNATASLRRSMDRNSNGNALISLYQASGNETYRAGVGGLREAIDIQPRNQEGGLWYFVYPNWSYLDGMYSLAPFYTIYTTTYQLENATAALADVNKQMDLLYEHCFDNATQLLVHGYDDSRTAVWANNQTGASPWVWGRAMGWYAMALVDTLEVFPASEGRNELLRQLEQLSEAIVNNADSATGAWYQIIGQNDREGNYIESSGSAMFVYSLLKGVRLGYLPLSRTLGTGTSESNSSGTLDYIGTAKKAYEHIVNAFVVDNGNGTISYNGTVAVCSLNSTATFEYYVSRPILYNSVLGSNAFVLASTEYERLQQT